MFKPELLNRFDDIIVFRKLDKADVVKILEIELSKVRSRLAAKAIQLELTSAATEFLVTKGFDPSLGARPLRRTVERFLEDPLAEELLRGILSGGVIEVAVAEGGLALVFRMRGELALRTPQPAEEPVRAALPPAATVEAKAKPRASRKKSDQG